MTLKVGLWRAPVSIADLQQRNAIVARMKRTRAGIQQMFDDIAHWNAHVRRPTEAPLMSEDVDPSGKLRRWLKWLDEHIKAAEN